MMVFLTYLAFLFQFLRRPSTVAAEDSAEESAEDDESVPPTPTVPLRRRYIAGTPRNRRLSDDLEGNVRILWISYIVHRSSN